MRALLSVYDKEGLVELAQGLVGPGLGAGGQRQHRRPAGRGRHRAPRGGRGHRLARDARRPGQDAAPEDPRRHPGRPVEGRAPGRPGGPRHRGRSTWWWQPLPVLVGPLDRADRRRRPDHGARRGQEPRPRRRRRRRPTTRSCSRSCGASGSLSAATRRRLARAAFAHTAAYDAAIVAWLDAGGPEPVAELDGATEEDVDGVGVAVVLPPTLHLTLERTEVLRYGENPHQRGARYRVAGDTELVGRVVQHGGKELSYLNLFDGDAAWRLVHELAADAGVGPGGRHHQARQPVRRRGGRRPGHRLRAGARVRRAVAPSAASWPSAAT